MRQILHRYTQAIIWEGDVETVKDAIVAAIEARADLSGANADLSGANLWRGNLSGANLAGEVRLAIAHVRVARDLDTAIKGAA